VPASGDRLLWALLAETGLRLGEALGLQHRDRHTGLGDTPWIEVVPRDHPHGVRVKGQAYRKLFVSDELDRLYGGRGTRGTGATPGRRGARRRRARAAVRGPQCGRPASRDR
jgi:integrase